MRLLIWINAGVCCTIVQPQTWDGFEKMHFCHPKLLTIASDRRLGFRMLTIRIPEHTGALGETACRKHQELWPCALNVSSDIFLYKPSSVMIYSTSGFVRNQLLEWNLWYIVFYRFTGTWDLWYIQNSRHWSFLLKFEYHVKTEWPNRLSFGKVLREKLNWSINMREGVRNQSENVGGKRKFKLTNLRVVFWIF